MAIGIIAGSGLYELSGLELIESRNLSTPYGEPSCHYMIGRIAGRDMVFLPRHGIPHRIPPHRINYRANIWGFKELGVKRIISITAVGCINPSLNPQDILIPDQIIDMTGGKRISTFYDDEVVHVDFTEPYCPEMREIIISSSKVLSIPVIERGTYIAVNGPRLETSAEIRFFGMIGADVVGMTGMPEAVLARELEICFSGIAVVTNYAAGVKLQRLTTKEVIENMSLSYERVVKILREAIQRFPEERACPCKDILKDSRI